MDNMQLWLISSTDSINLNSGADGFYLNPDLDGLTGLPDIRSSNGVNAGYDGGWTSTQLWDARLITIRGLIVDKDGSQVEAKRKALTKLVGQGKTEPLTLKFVTEFGRTYTCTVRATSCTMALQNIFSRQEYQIQLRADDPLIYDDGGDDIKATLRVQTDSEGFEIPFDIPLDISGGADPVVVDAGEDANYPIITMYGELHSPTIVNQTTNQQLQLGADLSGSSLEWTEYDTASGSSFQIQNGAQYDVPLTLTEITGNATQDGTPTPDAPVAVNTTSGENVVQITGKNLCYKTELQGTSNIRFYMHRPSGSSFTISATINVATANNSLYLRVDGVDYGVAGTLSGDANTRQSRTLTPNPTQLEAIQKGSEIYLLLYKNNAGFTLPTDAQIENSNTATTYEPYQGQEFEVNLGKNLLNPADIAQGTWINQSIQNTCTFFLPIYTGQTITVSNQNTATWRFSMGLCETPHAGTNTQDTGWQTGTSKSLTAQSNGYLYVQLRKNDVSNITPSSIPDDVYMVERGSTATTYAPYFTPIELAKIGTYQDRIYKNDDKWYIEKQVGKVVLDGTESTLYATSGTSYAWSGAGTNFVKNVDFFTNYASTTPSSGTRIKIPNNNIYFYDSGYTSLDNLKTALASTNLVVYAPVATPTTTEITDSTLLAQLNFIANLYGGTNNIMLVGTGAQGEIGVEYGTGYIEIPADVAVIDCKDRTVMLNGANAYNLLVPGSEFIQLQPGENKLYLTSESTGDGGYAEIKFKTGNLSI